MKKKILTLLILVVCISLTVVRASANDNLVHVFDNGDLLTDYECEQLSKKIIEISSRHNFDIVILTTDSLSDKSPRDYADDYYDDNGRGFGTRRDGILLLISTQERDYYISTHGYGITAFTDYGLEYVENAIISDLSQDEYYNAFDRFADVCDELLSEAKNNKPYDTDNRIEGYDDGLSFDFGSSIIISVILGVIISFIAVSIMKSKLKSVHMQRTAKQYIKHNSMNITSSNEMFLYKTLSRRPRPKDNSSSGGSSTHRSSSGATHGGRGGKF